MSASTLTHTIVSYSFPKEGRFNKGGLKACGSMYNLGNTIHPRATSLGKGSRKFLPKRYMTDMGNLPAPNHYKVY